MLKVENLSTSYKLIDGDVHVLNDLNFEIHDNEIFGIAGESGCGKTTLLKTLYDIIEFPLEIDKGKVILSGEKNGQSFSYESGNIQKTWWNNISYVVQKGILKMLMRLQKQLKNTMVIVSHDMGVHYQITDRMAIMYSGSIIELGPTDAIFNDPIHPYTKMLVDSLPRVGDKSQKVGIPGRPPALKNPPPGCRFAARCPHATDRCRQEIPEFIEVKPGRFAACHLLKKEGEKNG